MRANNSYFQEHCEKHDGRDFHGVHSVAVHPMRELVGEQRAAGERSWCPDTPARAHSQRPDFLGEIWTAARKDWSWESTHQRLDLSSRHCCSYCVLWCWLSGGAKGKRAVWGRLLNRGMKEPCTPGCAYNSMRLECISGVLEIQEECDLKRPHEH